MYMNTGYLNHSHMDFKDKSRPLVVGSCGTYRLSSHPKLPTYRPRGRLDYQIIQESVRAVIAASFCYLYADIKKDRPEGGASERQVQGLASENDRKVILPHFARKCKPRAVREEVNLL